MPAQLELLLNENDGVVYTKEWVVRLILDIAGYTPNRDLTEFRVLEPSCGCGSFVVEIVDRLCRSASARGKLNKDSVASCLVSFDIDAEAVAECRRRVAATLCSYGIEAQCAATLARAWVLEGDFLLSGYTEMDFVVGNPPYVRSRRLSRETRARYCRLLETMTMGCDLYIGFIERGLKTLSAKGKLCYICSDRWLQNAYGRKLRSFVSNGFNLDALIRLHGVDAFASKVSAYPSVVLVGREHSPLRYIECPESFSSHDAGIVCDSIRGDRDIDRPAYAAVVMDGLQGSSPLTLGNASQIEAVSKMRDVGLLLSDADVNMGIGIATGADDVFVVHDPDIVEHDRLMPLLYMKEYRKAGHGQKTWLVNPWKDNGELVDLRDYPHLEAYLESKRTKLEGRYVAKANPNAWYRTIDKIDRRILGQALLCIPDISLEANPILTDGRTYPHHNLYWVHSETWDLEVLGGLLLSDTTSLFIDSIGVKMRGGTKRFQAQYLKTLPVPELDSMDSSVLDGLKRAFRTRDKAEATRFASRAYGLEGIL